MNCQQCGASVGTLSKFCTRCGAPLNTTATPNANSAVYLTMKPLSTSNNYWRPTAAIFDIYLFRQRNMVVKLLHRLMLAIISTEPARTFVKPRQLCVRVVWRLRITLTTNRILLLQKASLLRLSSEIACGQLSFVNS